MTIDTTVFCIAALCVAVMSANCNAQSFPSLEDLEKNRVERVHGKELLDTFTAKVVGVTDGDTLDLLVNGKKKIRVRLDSIDAPESGQEFGKRSKQALSDLVFGREVIAQKVGEDRYKRTLAFVRVDDKDLATEMVRTGFAWIYRKYSVSPTLHEFEAKAREMKVGVWSHGKPVEPWE